MNNQHESISVALLVHNARPVTDWNTMLSPTEITLSRYQSVAELENTGHYDVIVIHYNLLQTFNPEQYRNSSIIILADRLDSIPELLPRLTGISYHTILTPQIEARDLIATIRAARESVVASKRKAAGSVDEGKSVAVTSFANGTGKSTIAYNLAGKLTGFIDKQSICIVDLNRPLSQSRAFLNVEPGFGWHTILPLLTEGTVPSSKIANVVSTTPQGFSLLSGPVDAGEEAELTGVQLAHLVASLRKVFTICIFDMPVSVGYDGIKSLEEADLPLVIVDTRASGISASKKYIEYSAQEVQDVHDNLRYIINGIDDSSGRTAEVIAPRLGVDPFAVVDYDYDAVRHFNDQGKLFDDKSLILDRQFYIIAEKVMRELF